MRLLVYLAFTVVQFWVFIDLQNSKAANTYQSEILSIFKIH